MPNLSSTRCFALVCFFLAFTASVGAQTVSGYNPPQTTSGFLPSTDLNVTVSLNGFVVPPTPRRAYWGGNEQAGGIQLTIVSAVDGASTFVVAIPPSLRASAVQQPITLCQRINLGNGQFDAACTDAPQSARFVVNPPPSISTGSPLAPASTNAFYTNTLAAAGGTGARTWSLQSGSSLPPNLSLNPSSGVISGTPTQAGNFTFTVVVSDSLGVSASRLFALAVSSTLSIVTPATLPTAGVSVTYSTTIQAAGGAPPYFFDTNLELLPPGLVLNTQSGVLSGTPSVPGSYSFPVTVFDSQEASASRTFFITVSATTSSPSILTESILPTATLNQVYSLTFLSSGGNPPYQYFLLSGDFPPGLTLNSSEGTLSGTPTQLGDFTFALDVMDSQERVSSKSFTLSVIDGLQITTSQLPGGTTGVPYPNTPIQVSGGTPPYAYSLGQANVLPSGLFLNPTTGVISGTPTQGGVFQITVVVRDSFERQASRSFSIAIATGLRFRSTSPLPSGTVGVAYDHTLEAEGGVAPFVFSLVGGSLPAGLSLSTTGRLQGTPAAPFDGAFTIRATDTSAPPLTVERLFAIRISDALVITTQTLPPGTVQQSYSVALSATGGVPAYVFSLADGDLPPGVHLNGTGTLSGTPTASGNFTFTVRAIDQEEHSDTQAYTLEIRAQPISGAIVSLQSSNPAPNSQQSVAVSLSSPRPQNVDGSLILEFTPSVTPAVDDPAIRFLNGERSRPFQIPANQLNAVFEGNGNSAFQTGTVAGTITIRAQLEVDGADATPTPPPSTNVVLPPVAPTLTNLTVNRTPTGLSVQVRGFSTPRSMTSATLNFIASAGSNIQGGLSFTIDLAPAFTTWYNGSQSSAYGSQFQLTLPITITGSPTDITGLSIVLRNSLGDSNSLSSTF